MHACIHTYIHTHIYIFKVNLTTPWLMDGTGQGNIHTHMHACIHTHKINAGQFDDTLADGWHRSGEHTYIHTYIHTYMHAYTHIK